MTLCICYKNIPRKLWEGGGGAFRQLEKHSADLDQMTAKLRSSFGMRTKSGQNLYNSENTVTLITYLHG